VTALTNYFRDYIHEIILVNDNSRDRTADVAGEIARQYRRVRVINRKPPNGVGRALRDGLCGCNRRLYSDHGQRLRAIVPEMRDLFDAVAEGYDGAIGSRFTQESIMVNYPFAKIVSNRSFISSRGDRWASHSTISRTI